MIRTSTMSLGPILYFTAVVIAGGYFVFAAVQGPFGVFERAGIAAETRDLRSELAALRSEVARMGNLTHRLSDEFLDLDLLDEQARDLLGLIRADEVVVR